MPSRQSQSRDLFTARQIADALGVSPQAIRQRLKNIRPSGAVVVAGNETSAWSLHSLPINLRLQLDRIADAAGCKETTDLALPAEQPQRALPEICEYHKEDVAAAVKLRSAMERALVSRNSPLMQGGDLVRMGLDDYRRAFGHSITERHWRRLFERTLGRAGATEDFTRLEIFLPDNPRPKPVTTESPTDHVEENGGLASIRNRIHACIDPLNPSASERELIWVLSLEWFEEQRFMGIAPRVAKRTLFTFLMEAAPALARTRDSLRKIFDARLKIWNGNGRTFQSIQDKRPVANNARRKAYSEEEIGRLVYLACQEYRGRVAPAVRKATREDPAFLTDDSGARFQSRTKSYVPKTLLDEVSRRVEMVAPYFQGPRAANTAVPALDLSYDDIYSMDCVVLDDFTFNCYVVVIGTDGHKRLSRCQVILAVDFRSLRVLGWVLLPEEQPNSLAAWNLCKTVFREHGLSKALYLEQGKVFKDSILMTGGPKAEKQRKQFHGWDLVPDNEVETGWRQLGVQIIHARRARSKPIERVGDLLQQRMDGLPGWAGRDERRERPESLTKLLHEAERGGIRPEDHFHTFGEYNNVLNRVFMDYNADVQEGKRNHFMSPDQTFESLWPRHDPPVRFDSSNDFMVATCRKPLVVEGSAVSFSLRGETYCYRDDLLHEHEGQTMIGRWDPEMPEFITLTDKLLRSPIIVRRSGRPNALKRGLGLEDPVFDAETGKVKRHAAASRGYYSTIKACFDRRFRDNTQLNPRLARLSEAIARGKEEVEQQKREGTGIKRKLEKIARQTGRRVEELPESAAAYDDEYRSALRELKRQAQKEEQ